MKFTDEQCRKIGMLINDVDGVAIGSFVQAGRAAVAAVAPLVLAEALAGLTQDEVTAFLDAADPDDLMPEGWARTFNEVVFANRLAALSAKPDPAVEAVQKVLLSEDFNRGTFSGASERIVAAVDEARAAK